MIALNEDALICDLAESYGVFNYKELPVTLLATLCTGLRADSRINMEINGLNVPIDTLLLASVSDRLGVQLWAQGGAKKHNKPYMFVNSMLINKNKTSGDYETFDTPKEFEETRKKILKRKEG